MSMKIWNEYAEGYMPNSLNTPQEVLIKALENCYGEEDNWIFFR